MFFFVFFYLNLYSAFCDSGTRFSFSLNGLWQFKLDENNRGLSDKWFNSRFSDNEFLDMPVPSSYNEITVDRKISDYVGWVWYQKNIKIPLIWINDKRIVLKIGGAHYYTMVWINSILVGEHEGGHIPFEFDLTKSLPHDVENYVLTVAVNNTLNENTIPQGYLVFENDSQRYPPGYKNYHHNFDYFDYSGLNGNVEIYVTNHIYIEDVDTTTGRDHDGVYFINYTINFEPKESNVNCSIELYDPDNLLIDTKPDCDGTFKVHYPQLWWPIFHNKPSGKLYKFKAILKDQKDDLDVVETMVGIRDLKWNDNSFLINDEKIYLRGFGMHQDSELRGRGFDYVHLTKDINLLKWSHANAIRTSHYPYFEEFLDLTDKNGIMVILETPACSLNSFNDQILEKHKNVVKEIWSRFKNHPSIVMWSLANEPESNIKESESYFKTLSHYVKSLDPSRPVTFVTSQQIGNEKAVQHFDVVSVNRYSGWYQDSGKLELVAFQVATEMANWHDKYSKPVMLTEYGAGSISGFHSLPSVMWSEEYQTDLFKEHFKAFDCLRSSGFFIGELIWNFIDFNTPQEYIRPGRCAKGVFTRNRQPKSAAFTVRERYVSLVNKTKCGCDGLLNVINEC